MKKLSLTFLFISLFSLLPLIAQQLNCATDAIMNDLLNKDINLKQKHQDIENQILNITRQGVINNRSLGLVTLPIVFHIIHNNGIENISDSEVIKTLALLNEAFSNSGEFNEKDGVNTGIQFCLAQRTPDGKATTGITRTQSNLTNCTIETEDVALKNLDRWNPLEYINVWLVKDISSLQGGSSVVGYAYFASAHGLNIDGIVIESAYANGSKSNSSVLIHEMGHYLNCYHTFQGGCPNSDCLQQGDRVCDTPPDEAVHTGCNFNSCSSDADDNSIKNPLKNDIPDFTQNFMDYSPLSCYRTLTQGQSVRMNLSIEMERKSLLKSKGCIPSCPNPININFTASKLNITDSTNVVFTNSTFGANDYKWLVNNDIKSNSKDFNFTFSSPGIYQVTLIAGNNSANCEEIKTITITVKCSVSSKFQLSKNNAIASENINATNNSTNATAYEWFLDGNLYNIQKDITFSFSNPGNHKVMLIAKSQNCADTSIQNIFVSCNHNITITTPKTKYKIGEVFQLNASSPLPNLTYQWSLNGNIIGNSKTLSTSSNSEGVLTYCLSTTDNNCTAIQCIDILISQTDLCDVSFIKTYENIDSESAKCIINSTNGGYIVGGGRKDGSLLLQIDKNLNIINQKAFELTNAPDEILDMIIDSENKLVAVGSYNPGSTLETDFILKYDYINSKVIWARKIDENGFQPIIQSITQHPLTKNYIIAGQAYISSSNNIDAMLAEIDYITGKTIWLKLYDMTDQTGDAETFYKVITKNNYIYTASRYTYGINPGFQGMRHSFSKFGTGGQQIFSKSYLYPILQDARLYLTDMVEENNEFYACALGDISGIDLVNAGSSQILKISENGELIWAKNYFISQSQNQRTYKIVKIPNGIILLGYYQKNGNQNIYAIQTDNNGNVIWKKSYDFGGNDDVRGATLSNNEIIFTGTTEKNGNKDILIGKIDLNGNLTTTCQKVSDLDLLVTNLPNNTYNKNLFEYSATLTNDSIPAIPIADEVYTSNNLCNTSLTDLNIKNITAFCNKDSLIQITICNNGTKAFKESIPISFYDKNPEITKANVIKKGKIAVELAINECKTYNIKAPILPNQKIYIAINDLAQTPTPFNLKNAVLNQVSAECVFTNNIDSFSLQAGNKTLDLGADKVICNSQIIVLNAKKGYVSYIWQDGSKDSTFTAFYPGKYWVKVKDECGLEQIDTIEIKLNTLKVELGNNRIICEGENITLSPNADFDQYFWSSNQNPIACNNCKSINEKPNKKTTYYIVVTKNGCISNDSVTITPILFKPNIGKDTSICAAQKIVLKSNIKSDINAWKSIKGNNTICTNCDSIILNPLQNTKIIFEASLGNCKNTDTIEIRIKVEKIDLGKDTEICLGDSLLLNASGFSNISWSSNPNQVLCISCDNLLVSPKIVTQYYVKAEKNNCIASDSILITPIIIDLKLARDTSLCKGDTLKLFASGKFDSYVWKKNNSIINCNNCPTLKFVGEDKAQDIQLQVTKGKCKASAHTFVNLEDEIICLTCRAGKVYLPNIFSPNDDGINDEFYPQSSDCESSVNIFQIFDRWGVLVFEEKNFPLNDSKFAWKGDFKKQEAQIGIYAYYLELQQKSGKITTQKGDVMLIR